MADVALDAAAGALEKLGLCGNTREHALYFGELAEMPLERLEQQPAQQRAAAASIQHQLAELCLRQTATFVGAYGAARAVPQTVATLDGAVERLHSAALPGVVAAAERFGQSGRAAIEKRAAQTQLEAVYDTSLKCFIDTPLLIRACVDCGAYDDALQVAKHFRGLPSTWATGAVAGAVAAEVAEELTRMRAVLLGAFREEKLQQPRARRLVALLDALGEVDGSASRPDICAAFLKARYELAERALDSHAGAAAVLQAWKDTVLGACAIALSEFDESVELVATFSDAAQALLARRLEARLDTLVPEDGSVSGTLEAAAQEVAALHTQLCYVGARFSDYGLYFDVTMQGTRRQGVFERTALRLWRISMERMVIESSKERYVGGEPGDKQGNASGKEDAGDTHRSPCLARYPALATCAKTLVAALNALRQFAPLSIHAEVLRLLGEHLDVVATRINGAQRAARPSERVAYERAGAVFATELVAWAAGAVHEGIYGKESHRGS
ncbi:hypothetical protein MCUN1_002725 [Malassezia cuniculi]|uniref:Conserved oligomeric Golgi complex subunit 8 n=1 Tax=Malassezia cuniculi TaxID=948313 RepID=A0AAF0EZZ8_9BASI|nr:hypothetical protein MCUN1_002725 [Malassezia cuniculi]